jgi:poly-beta-1,6-N-acetyl-D-glucosamine synthase
MPNSNGTYVVVSPIKDEEKHIETTIEAVLKQTARPKRWVIVDDASTDKTPMILDRYANEYHWIQLIRIDRGAERSLGWAEIRAFSAGYDLVRDEDYDFIVKLDGDLDFPPDYFALLMERFHQDEKLGIASGECMERNEKGWYPSSGPPYHAVGASKVVRRKCFEDIGGFVLHRGWDTVDEIRAQAKGWKTKHFDDVKFFHLRNEGAAAGSISTGVLHGEVYYWTGGGALFLFLKFLHRSMSCRPYLIGGLAMLWGYFRLWVTRKERIVSDDEAKSYRRLLNGRIWSGLTKMFKRNDKETLFREGG